MLRQECGADELDVASLPIFEGVSNDLLAAITPDLIWRFSHDEVICHQDEEADALLVLLHGQAAVWSKGIYLVPRGPYSIIGEQAFINRTRRSATVTAQGMVKALVLPRPLVERLMADTAFVTNLLRLVSAKLAESTNDRAEHYRDQQLLYSEFGAHLSPHVRQQLLAKGEAYGNPRYADIVILFSDIRSFTARSAGMSEDEIAIQLGSYLDAVVDAIHKYGGMVDKFVGDAVMAIWGYAPSESDLAQQTFDCAQELVQLAASMSYGGSPIAIGVGLNAGRVFVGNIGGPGKRQFTVLGQPVNLASRYESKAKDLGSPIVVGPALYERLRPDTQNRLTPHHNQSIKGCEAQTLYTSDPASIEQGEA